MGRGGIEEKKEKKGAPACAIACSANRTGRGEKEGNSEMFREGGRGRERGPHDCGGRSGKKKNPGAAIPHARNGNGS